MFPNSYFGLFPPFPREDKVFVMMSFDERFKARWEKVIGLGIQDVLINNASLEPHRVDTRHISDSVLTEILGGIANDRLLFADITTMERVGQSPMRNGNVMYEVGLAHSARLPEETLIFRSDKDRLLFDVSNVRVNDYDPEGNPDQAREKVRDAIVEALREIDLKRQLAVRSAAQSLDVPAWSVLTIAVGQGGVRHFETRTMGQALANSAKNAAIGHLLELGAVETEYLTITPEIVEHLDSLRDESMLKYKPTAFGKAILKYVGQQTFGKSTEEVRRLMEARLDAQEGATAVDFRIRKENE